jgi:Domain of unknown function (DUF4399)
MRSSILTALAITLFSNSASAQKAVSFVEPKDGATLSSPFKVKLDVKGLTAAPAGEAKPGTGHHHVLINSDGIAKGEDIPFIKRNLHLNQGQSEIMVTLAPGNYKLTAQFGEGTHKSLGPDHALTINVIVK